jgi:alpha-amylase
VADVRLHWAKLGLFRQAHVAVGAGVHQQLQAQPYVFSRVYSKNGVSDKVVVALDLPAEKAATIDLHGVFADGQKVKDYYSGKSAVVAGGKVSFAAGSAMLLIGQE